MGASHQAFLQVWGPEAREARYPAVQPHPSRPGARAAGPERPGEGCPWVGGRGRTSLSLKCAAGASARSTRLAGAEESAVLHPRVGTLGWMGKKGQREQRQRAHEKHKRTEKEKRAQEPAEWTATE